MTLDSGFQQMATKSKELVLLCLIFRLMKETGRDKITMSETQMKVILNMQPFPICLITADQPGTFEKQFSVISKSQPPTKARKIEL